MDESCLIEVWSGGQIGADIAGLRAARAVGLKTGGWIPRGFRTHEKSRSEYAALYGLVETESAGYPARTKANVRDSDATLILGDNPESAGCALTRFACEQYGKPYLVVTVAEMAAPGSDHVVAVWIRELKVRRLNVAGNRDAPETVLEEWFRRVLLSLLGEVSSGSKTVAL